MHPRVHAALHFPPLSLPHTQVLLPWPLLNHAIVLGWQDFQREFLSALSSRKPAWIDLCFSLSTVGTPFPPVCFARLGSLFLFYSLTLVSVCL